MTVHVVPVDSPPGRDHTPSQRCWCGPMYLGHDMAEPTVQVYRHRTPPQPRREYYPLHPIDHALLSMRAFGDEE